MVKFIDEKTSNDYHCEVKFKWGFKKSFMMSLLFENCNSVDLNSRHSVNGFLYGLYIILKGKGCVTRLRDATEGNAVAPL